MSQTIQISKTHFDELIARVVKLEKIVAKLLEKEPQEGTKEWWEWSDRKALEDIKKGKYIEFNSAKDMVNFLKKTP